MKCNKCGNELKTNDKFCTKCGTSVSSNIKNTRTSKNKIILIIILITLLLMIGLNIFKNSKSILNTEDTILENIESVVESTENVKGNAENIAQDAKNSYGKIVTNYDEGNLEWEIFYADTDNIYLISKTVESNVSLRVKDVTEPSQGKYSEGSILLTNNPDTYPSAKKWFSSWINSGYTSKYSNMKATLYLLDSTQWEKYVNDTYAEWAIGGPTLELLCSSVNDIQDTHYKAIPVCDKGYETTISGGLTKGTLWNRDECYWIASPYYDRTSDIACATMLFFSPLFESPYLVSYSSDGYGIRPVVCLKSNIILEKNEDSVSYSIVGKSNNERSIKSQKNNTTGIEQAIKDRAFEVTDDLSESKLKAAFTDGSLRFYYDNWEKCLEDAKKLNIITSDKPYLTMEEELEQQYYNEQNYNNQSYNEDYNEQPSEQNNSVSNEQPTLVKTYNTIKKEDSSDYHIIKIYEYSNGEYSYETDWYTYGSIIPSRISDKRYKTLDEALTSAIQSFEGISLTISDLTEE